MLLVALCGWVLPSCASLEMVPRLVGDRYERCESELGRKRYEDGRRLLAEGRVTAAVDLLRQAVEECPQQVLYHIAYQNAAVGLAPVKQDGVLIPAPATVSMRTFYAGLADDGVSPLPPYFTARLQRLAQREAPAQELLDEALKRDRKFYFAYYERGVLWRGVGRPHRAIGYLRRSLAIRPGCLLARQELADCYAELWEWSRAVEHYRIYLDAVPQDAEAQRAYLSLIVYRVEGRIDEAAQIVSALLRASPADLSLQMDQAAILWKQGHLDRSAAAYRRVLKVDHEHARAALNLGNLHYDLGRSSAGQDRRAALATARRAFRYFESLEKVSDAYDWFDLHLAVKARLREIDLELGSRSLETVTWSDL